MATAEDSRSALRRAPWLPTVALWVLIPIAILALGAAGGTLRSSALPIAIWWPAVGLALWFVLRVRADKRLLAIAVVFVVTVLANATTGRPLLVCLVYAALNAVEVALAITFLGSWTKRFQLDSFVSATRFVGSVLGSSLLVGTAVAFVGAAFYGTTIPDVAIVAFASHSSAMMLIGPFAALPPRIRDRINPIELLLYSISAVVAIVIAFGPVSNAPLAFLVFAVLAWGTLRFPIEIGLLQSLLVSVAVLILVLGSGGSFGGNPLGALDTAITLVTFMSSIGVFTVLVVSARYEGRSNTALTLRAAHKVAEAERERATALGMQLDLERQREDFVTATSHELRTPATSILGYSELLTGASLPEEQAEWSRAVHRSATRLKLLLDDLHHSPATVSNLGERVAIDALVDDVLAAHLPDADARGTTITATVPAGLAAWSNAIDARRALWNLVSNAVKFSSSGEVRITAHRDADTVVIVVTDNGPGMAADTLANAFERFYRGAEADGRSASGLGLGLANAREFAARNGGDVLLASTPGHGASASLILPAAT